MEKSSKRNNPQRRKSPNDSDPMRIGCRSRKLLIAMIAVLLLASLPLGSWADDPAAEPPKHLQQRIDFSTAHIMGQSIKSGAVYLMHRKKSDIKNMLQVRQNYREEIIEDYGLENTAIAQHDTEPSEDQRK
jgi:hypothetical protein